MAAPGCAVGDLAEGGSHYPAFELGVRARLGSDRKRVLRSVPGQPCSHILLVRRALTPTRNPSLGQETTEGGGPKPLAPPTKTVQLAAATSWPATACHQGAVLTLGKPDLSLCSGCTEGAHPLSALTWRPHTRLALLRAASGCARRRRGGAPVRVAGSARASRLLRPGPLLPALAVLRGQSPVSGQSPPSPLSR